MIKILLLFPVVLVLVSCGDKTVNLERHHEICDEWLNSEQTEWEATNSYHPYAEGLGLKWERGWTEVERYCKALKGITEEF
jgi:hypothetical protein